LLKEVEEYMERDKFRGLEKKNTNFRNTKKTTELVEQLVIEGYYATKSDFMRSAVRNELNRAFKLRMWEMNEGKLYTVIKELRGNEEQNKH
jgi:Arc/MetJ-type ribon-helix-helix transcriptional regulator